MHELDPYLAFEPSKNTKSMWRYSRKTLSRHAGLSLPGLFQTSRFPLDLAGFFLVMVLELWGLYNLQVVGDISFVYVAGLFLADVVFAVCRHLPAGVICEEENRLVVTSDRDESARIQARIARLKMLPTVFSMLIVLLAAIKVVGFFGLQGGEFNGLTVTILLSYALAAVLHITCTGHFLFAIAVSLLLARDKQSYLKSRGGLLPRTHTFVSAAPVKEIAVDRHRLYADGDSNGNGNGNGGANGRRYVFETVGLLSDRQLLTFVFDQQNDGARCDVARAGVRHQLEILEQEARTGNTQGS